MLDTGIGIAAEQSQLIFSEFYQIGNAARRREHGLGLGLAIVKRTADLLKLRIGLRSVLGKGSVFSVWLPVAHRPSLASPPPAVTATATGAKTILVVDDDAGVLDSMQLLLTSWGHKVVTANSLDSAVQALQLYQAENAQAPIDLILSDFRLAESITGIDVVQALRQASAYPIPAVLITGDTSVDSINRISQANLQILHKPLAPEALMAVLRDLH